MNPFNHLVWAVVGCTLLAFFAINAPAIQKRFAAWLAAPSEIECRYIELHKGVRK